MHLTWNPSNRTVSSSDDPRTSIPGESEFDREFSGQLCSLICATHSLAPMLSHPCYTYVVFIHITIGKDHLSRKWTRLTHHQTNMVSQPETHSGRGQGNTNTFANPLPN